MLNKCKLKGLFSVVLIISIVSSCSEFATPADEIQPESTGAVPSSGYKGNLKHVIGDVKQAFMLDKIKTNTDCNNLFKGMKKLDVTGVRIPIFAEDRYPSSAAKTQLIRFYNKCKNNNFKIYANPAGWQGAKRIANSVTGLNSNTGGSVKNNDIKTNKLINRIKDFSSEFDCDWICPFNEDGKIGQIWSKDQINKVYKDLNGKVRAQLTGPDTKTVSSGIYNLNGTQIKQYVSIISTHNLDFEHNKWNDFINAAGNKDVWDSETNANKKFSYKDTRIEAAIKAGVDGVVFYDIWKGINLSNGSLNSTGENFKSKYVN